MLTLGTGAGTALFRDGELMPHLELAHHPVSKKGKTYDEYIGEAARDKAGKQALERARGEGDRHPRNRGELRQAVDRRRQFGASKIDLPANVAIGIEFRGHRGRRAALASAFDTRVASVARR